MNFSDGFMNILLPRVVDNLTALMPVFLRVVVVVLSPIIIVFATGLVVLMICPELRGILSCTVGEMWSNYKSERFPNSPIGRGYAAYKERSSDSVYMPIESYSLGPREDFDSPSLGDGVDYTGYGNVYLDHVDRED